jgi:1,2-dihydroxy-3-keto-5-methylthiopentene dioxygenase
MASIYLFNDEKSIHDHDAIASFLARENIAFGRFQPSEEARKATHREVLDDDERERVMASHQSEAARFRALPGFRQDIVCFWPTFVHLDKILSRFAPIHFHYENEYWYCFDGAARFGFLGARGEKYCITLEQGEFLRVPEGRWQWFELTEAKYFKSIRYFYTDHSAPSYATPREFTEECTN